MRRILSLFTMLMLCSIFAFAQNRVVTGKVTDKDGAAVAFASVKVKGSKTGVSADASGAYSIRVKDGDVLEISAQGFKMIDVPVGTQTLINTYLERSTTSELKEVVITSAFGTKRAARSTASNVQNVNAEQLGTARQTNINNALAGKVAGVQVRSQASGKLGAETTIRLRGENLINNAGGSGALYVVDGTIVPSGNDINTDDIEDITVLQGPAAAALFGPEGSNGAIVINTKKAKRGAQKTLGVEINTGVQFDKVYILPNYQNAYAGGNGVAGANLKKFTYVAGFHPAGWAALDGKYYPDYEDDESWGPRMVGQEYIPWYAWYPGTERSFKTASLTPQPNNAREFFNTGVLLQNNIAFFKSADNYSFRASYTNQDQKGIIPTSWLKRNNFNINGSVDLSSRLTFSSDITYVDQKSNAENDDGYSNNTTGSLNNWFHRDLDMKIIREMQNYKTPEGFLGTWNHRNPDAWDPAKPSSFYGAYFWFNPYSYQNNVSNFGSRERLFGNVALTYKINNDLKFKMTYRKQSLNTASDVRQYDNLQVSQATANFSGYNYWEALSGRSAPWGGYGISNSASNRQNFEFLFTYGKKIKDFAINANAGVDILKTKLTAFNANTMGGLVIPDLFLLSNSKNNINQARGITNSGRRAMFVRGDVGFRNYLFLEGTFRRDFSSSEAAGYGINTKSVGVSFVFSDLIREQAPWLTYGKLRASTGEILNTLNPYQNSSLYGVNPQQWNGNFLMSEVNTLVDPKLHGAVNTEREVGLELRFLKNRLGLSATYWDRTNKDFPFDVSIYGGSGYSVLSTNAGKVTKKGVDLQATIVPIRTRNVDWTLTATWGKLIENQVVEIAPGIDRVVLGGAQGQTGVSAYAVSEVGQRWGQLRGIGFKRINGQPVLGADGFFVEEPEINFGSTLPDYTGGVQSSLTILKNFTLNINVDYSVGGKFASTSEWYGNGTGLFEATAVLNDRGKSIRDKVADGGGVHAFGVDATGKPVDYYVEARAYFQQFSYGAGIIEPYIRDLTFVKVRELSLGYKLPIEKMGLTRFVKNATFSIQARNPLLVYSKTKSFDPSEMSTISGEDGQLPGTRSIGVNLKLGF